MSNNEGVNTVNISFKEISPLGKKISENLVLKFSGKVNIIRNAGMSDRAKQNYQIVTNCIKFILDSIS